MTRAKTLATIGHHDDEPGNPFARVGSAPGRLSGTNGRRLRARYRTVSIFSGPLSDSGSAHFPGVDLSFSGEAGRGDRGMQTSDRNRSGVRESVQRYWRVSDRAGPVRSGDSLAGARGGSGAVRAAAFSALQSGAGVSGQRDVWEGDRMFSAVAGD